VTTERIDGLGALADQKIAGAKHNGCGLLARGISPSTRSAQTIVLMKKQAIMSDAKMKSIIFLQETLQETRDRFICLIAE
jgi:hypothetical protein